MDHANNTANPTALVNRPKLSAVPYSPLSFPRMPDGTMLVEATANAMLTCKGAGVSGGAGEGVSVEIQ